MGPRQNRHTLKMPVIVTCMPVPLGDDHLILKGGGGLQNWSGQIIYFHHGLGRKIYFRVNRGQNIYFQPQQIFEKAKKKKKKKQNKKKKKKENRGGGRARLSMFCITFCRLIARNIAYLVAVMF